MSFNDKIESIKTTLGEENSALIADDLLSLMSDYKSMEETTADQAKTIDALKVDKESLVSANAKLFQRIGSENHLTDSASQLIVEEKEPEKIKLSDIISDTGEIL